MSEAVAADDAVVHLERAASAYDDACDAVEEIGESRVEAVADAVESAQDLLRRYEERATGTGDFQAYVEFRGKFGDFVEGLDDDLVRRAAFEDANDCIDKRRLNESDFAAARNALAPAKAVADRLNDHEEAADRYRDACRAAKRAREERTERIAELQRLLELGEADLDADVSALREPVRAYDEAVQEAFTEFKREAPARQVLTSVDDAAGYPLVDVRSPPDDLLAFVTDHDAGTQPVSTLLDYADYSRSKLSHYVDDVGALKRAVGSNVTYLKRLDADPLTVGWPPPDAEALHWRARELVAVVDRFAGDEALARLHEVRALAHGEAYDRLREAAVARSELDDEDRRRLLAGEVEPELRRAREERDRIDEALATYDGP